MNSLKYKAIKGELLRSYEIAKWNEERFMQFLSFVKRFMSGSTISIKPEMLIVAEKEILGGPTTFHEELLYRINCFSTDPATTTIKFRNRLMNMVRQVGGFLKRYPSQVTDDMRKEIEGNPRMAWSLVQVKSHTTKIGATITVPDTLDRTGVQTRNVGIQDPQTKLIEAQIHLTDLYLTLVKSVKVKDLKDLTAKDRIALITRLGPIVNTTSKIKPNIGVFNQLVLNKASKDDLEKSLREFSQSQEE